MVIPGMHRATRAEFLELALDVAPRLLGGVLETSTDDGDVALRITEVEAYHGKGSGDVPDPGSHARMGRTARNATMWGEAGRLYIYLSHGIHSCVNTVCGPEGRGDAILLRAGEVLAGRALARRRREARGVVRANRDLARGPGRLGSALGLDHARHDGVDAIRADPRDGVLAQLWLRDDPLADISRGPRVGVAGIAGTDAYPWRFWIPGDPTVSPFRAGRGT